MSADEEGGGPLTPAQLFGSELRRLRTARGMSLGDLCRRCAAEGRVVGRGYLGNVEFGTRLPADDHLARIADDVLQAAGLLSRLWAFADANRSNAVAAAKEQRREVLAVAAEALAPVVSGDVVLVPYIEQRSTVAYMRMSRRAFLATGGLATASVVSGVFAQDQLSQAEGIAADVVSGDPRRVTDGQTSHVLDLAVASMVARHGMRPNGLVAWMAADDPVLRVNAAGIAAKMRETDLPAEAVTCLAVDEGVRIRYITAASSRALGLTWSDAHELAERLDIAVLDRAAVDALVGELTYEADAGARWCAALLLAKIWEAEDHPQARRAADALEEAVAVEECASLRTAYGRALARRPLVAA